MVSVAVVGAGQIGDLIASLLVESGDYEVSLFDSSETQLARVPAHRALKKKVLDVSDEPSLEHAISGHAVVISACPYHLTTRIASAAIRQNAHYLDLTEDVASTQAVIDLSKEATTALIPQCGLAPGFVSILASNLLAGFDEPDTVKLKVGALPRYPSNTLSYNLTWSPEGVINEYCEPCSIIMDGQPMEVPPLQQREEFWLDGVRYESFNTSGGLGTLADTLAGKVRNLSYQSIRYPGHAAIMRTLLQDLGLSNRRELLLDIFKHSVPSTMQDVVIIYVSASGQRDGRLEQVTYTNRIYGEKIADREFTAIQLSTASSACAVLDLLVTGRIEKVGFVRQEDIDLEQFLDNRFGRVFKHVESKQECSSSVA